LQRCLEDHDAEWSLQTTVDIPGSTSTATVTVTPICPTTTTTTTPPVPTTTTTTPPADQPTTVRLSRSLVPPSNANTYRLHPLLNLREHHAPKPSVISVAIAIAESLLVAARVNASMVAFAPDTLQMQTAISWPMPCALMTSSDAIMEEVSVCLGQFVLLCRRGRLRSASWRMWCELIGTLGD
jgi:hypothetical protein